MAYNSKKKPKRRQIWTFALTWLFLSAFMDMFELPSILVGLGVSGLVTYLVERAASRKAEGTAATQPKKAPQQAQAPKVQPQYTSERTQARAQAQKKSYGPEIDPIVEEGHKALSEMGRLYMSIKDEEIRGKINEIMRITDKIIQNAIADPGDLPQIKKFMTYYLPTTLKLLNTYDRMSAQGIEGENLDKTMKSINTMLDDAIEAYKKMLDSLFADQALDIETDIQVMNTMLAREGLTGAKDFDVRPAEGSSAVSAGSAPTASASSSGSTAAGTASASSIELHL
ncbi:MAG: 5-bromo-4-chloroindolyl phosphate hydrolysis family protein [Oscillospiraceae bacterium]|nr:5-bromo-4-chloroindolyl phosphate hydrolysis family protein [Oscillospiraceae bacterium]